jgi:GWxTD domain-containing protein
LDLRNLIPALLCLGAVASCAPTIKLSNEDLAYQYRAPSRDRGYEAIVAHKDAALSTLFIRFKTDRLNPVNYDDDQLAEVHIRILIHEGYESKTVLDSLVFRKRYDHHDQEWIQDQFDLACKEGQRVLVALQIKDLNSAFRARELIEVDKRHVNTLQSFLIWDTASDAPLFTPYLGESPVRVTHYKDDGRRYVVDYYNPQTGAAIPPFITNVKSKPITKVDSSFFMDPGEVLLADNQGIYLLKFDSKLNEGASLLRYHRDYPKLTDPEELVRTLRYITKNKEYNLFLATPDKQSIIDSFWIQKAGNMDRARVLIKEYYSRIQFSNRTFTSYKEGWKTDRALIFVVYGPPDHTYRNWGYETWIYEATGTEPTTRFVFYRETSKFSDHHYELQRDAFLQNSWNMAIHKWRHGRVSELRRNR